MYLVILVCIQLNPWMSTFDLLYEGDKTDGNQLAKALRQCPCHPNPRIGSPSFLVWDQQFITLLAWVVASYKTLQASLEA